jgi:hypothetical protein
MHKVADLFAFITAMASSRSSTVWHVITGAKISSLFVETHTLRLGRVFFRLGVGGCVQVEEFSESTPTSHSTAAN